MLAGAVLGARRGALSVALLLVLVAIGLPLLAGGRGGFSVFTGPTAGFLIGWVAGAYVTGLAAERLVRSSQNGFAQTLGFFAASVIGGIGIVLSVRQSLSRHGRRCGRWQGVHRLRSPSSPAT